MDYEEEQIERIAEYMVPYFPKDADGVDVRDYALQAYDAGVRP